MADVTIVPGIYRHFKGGKCIVYTVAKHTETGEEMVVYGDLDDENMWVRPASMWNETVWKDGSQYKRFELIDENPVSEIVELKRAKWRYQVLTVPGGKGQTYAKWSCSRCRKKEKKRSPYCPNCGAEMENYDA